MYSDEVETGGAVGIRDKPWLSLDFVICTSVVTAIRQEFHVTQR